LKKVLELGYYVPPTGDAFVLHFGCEPMSLRPHSFPVSGVAGELTLKRAKNDHGKLAYKFGDALTGKWKRPVVNALEQVRGGAEDSLPLIERLLVAFPHPTVFFCRVRTIWVAA
jgi:hypothetical protein